MKTIETLDISPFKRLVMTIGELPTMFIESMSYYEALAWLVDYIENKVVPVVNNNAEVTREVQTAFQELKDYVDHYFENLDVQEEINNKLDDMAEHGELVEVISAYLNAKSVLAFDTIADMAAGENLINGCFVVTYGQTSLGDGKGHLYKVRTKEESDTPDGVNLVQLDDPNLVAEIIHLDWGYVFGFDTVADMAAATTLFDGSFVSTYGKDALGDGGGRLYKVRTRVQADDPDGTNLVAIGDSLVAEIMQYDYMTKMHNTSQLTFYVDSSAGSDTNTGLTSEDPLQTIEEGFTRYTNKGFVSIYVYIRSGYSYTIHHRNFTGLNIHIKNYSTSGNPTTITFDSDTNYIFYQTHLNITGDASNIIQLVMSYPDREFYTDNGGFVMDYVNSTNLRMRLWGGALNAHYSTLAWTELQLSSGAEIDNCVVGCLRCVSSTANVYACTFKDQISTDNRSAQVYVGNSTLGISGVCYVYTTNRRHNTFLESYSSTIYLMSTLNNEGGSAFSTNTFTNNTIVHTNLARELALFNLASSNSISYGVSFQIDTGWINATLADGFSDGLASAGKLMYRRINEKVYVKGSVSGWTTAPTDTPCATLPAHYRPSSRIDCYAGTNGQNFAGVRIGSDGGICLMKDSGDVSSDRWYNIDTSFIVSSDLN